jgi:hypothetical protein
MTTTCTIEAAPFIPEPQHGAENLEGVHEHGQEWITVRSGDSSWRPSRHCASLYTGTDR